jgi:hypothetical protein
MTFLLARSVSVLWFGAVVREASWKEVRYWF